MYKDEKTLLYTVSLIFMTLASLAGFLATNSEEVEIWNTWVMLIFFFGLTSMASFCHYSFLYNDERKIIERKFLFLFYLIPLAFLTIFLVDKTIFYPNPVLSDSAAFGIFDNAPIEPGFQIIDLIWGFNYLVLIAIMFFPLFNFAKVFRNTDDKLERKRSAFFILGYAFPFIALPIDYLLPLVFEIRLNVNLSMVSLSLTGILFLVGILGEKLLDPSIAITNGFKFIVTTVIVSFVFAIVKELMVEFISESFFENTRISGFISVLFAVIILFPIHAAVEKLFHSKKDHTETTKA
jgi:hypothetical protein